MSTNRFKKADPKFVRSYERAMLRSAFASLFWAAIADRKKAGLTMVALAKAVGTSKHEISRWFKGDPNWTINTIAALAHALGLSLRIEAVDNLGRVYRPSGRLETMREDVLTSSIDLQPVKITRRPAGTSVEFAPAVKTAPTATRAA
jgi:transcriptional regulator with XRE-family HTH domain